RMAKKPLSKACTAPVTSASSIGRRVTMALATASAQEAHGRKEGVPEAIAGRIAEGLELPLRVGQGCGAVPVSGGCGRKTSECHPAPLVPDRRDRDGFPVVGVGHGFHR